MCRLYFMGMSLSATSLPIAHIGALTVATNGRRGTSILSLWTLGM